MRAIAWFAAVLTLAIVAGGCEKTRTERVESDLYWAARQGDVQKAQSLIDRGDSVRETDYRGQTPLHNAAEAGHIDVVRLLIDHDARLSLPDKKGRTPAALAMAAGHRAVVEYLVGRGAAVDLHLAAYLGDLARTRRLLENGGDFNAKDACGWTPLHYAASYDQRQVAKLLIGAGADLSIPAGRDDGAKCDTGETPLHRAVMAGHSDLAEMLIDGGADVNARARQGITPLYWAAREGKSDLVMLLVAKGADAGVRIEGDSLPHATPLGAAIWGQYVDIAEMLLAGRADVNAKDETGRTPLHRAAMNSARVPALEPIVVRMIELLVARGAEVGAKDEEGITPLHCAAYKGRGGAIELFLARGADVNARTVPNPRPDARPDVNELGFHMGPGATPLHHAVIGRDPNVAGPLLAHGAQMNAKDDAGNTPLHYAAMRWRLDAVTFLLARGAQINAANHDGATPLVVALRNGQVGTAKTLLAAGAERVAVKNHPALMPMEPLVKPELLLHKAIRLDGRTRSAGSVGSADSNGGNYRRDWITLLVENGADLNGRDEEGDTPLHAAVLAGDEETVRLLIAHGADVEAKNHAGLTPLDEATRRGQVEIAQLLTAKPGPSGERKE